ncbi:lipoate--protein ligase [Tetragenococcus solitarius]|uniref:lipoate--protein ligase n=1 Tax=Tetragenococcus solitarius TaxID=71453 RepID=A0ABN3Y4W3_9ENTE|nr:lipoate--protein ligase [Tetragenococcus solitarius]
MYLLDQKRKDQEVRDARYNYAIASYIANELELDEPIMRFYINQPAVIIGKHQNAFAEVDLNYLEKQHIQLVRRSSGGGSVYHDQGTLIYGFVGKDDHSSYQDFSRFTQPIIQALQRLGVKNAKFSGRNDLLINDKKFSGTSMLVSGGKVVVGGTLLLDADYETLANVLTPSKKKLAAKGIKSVESRVTALRPYLAKEHQEITIEAFRELLIKELFAVDRLEEIKIYTFSDKQWQRIDEIVEEKFGNWDWNFGRSRQLNYQRDHRFSFGTVEFQLAIDRGKICECQIFGDFFASGNLEEIETALLGVSLKKDDLLTVFRSFDLTRYFGEVTAEELVEVILSEM